MTVVEAVAETAAVTEAVTVAEVQADTVFVEIRAGFRELVFEGGEIMSSERYSKLDLATREPMVPTSTTS